MPITLPNLDDRTYADLIEEARSLVPVYAPEWTNHNPSDPGVTLVELFAYLTEMMLYRLNRVTDANVLAFLRLLNEPGWQPVPGATLAESVRETVLMLRRPYRAVTCEDFERLSFEASRAQDEKAASKAGRVARALCVPQHNLEAEDARLRYSPMPGHMSVILVPEWPPEETTPPLPTRQLVTHVASYLEERRLVTTRVHVVGPSYLKLTVRLTLFVAPDALDLKESEVSEPAERALRRFLHPLAGGPDRQGWPFGRDLYVSELYELLDVLPGVDYVTKTLDEKGRELDEVAVAPEEAARLRYNADGDLTAVEIKADELIEPDVKLEIVFPV